MNLQFTRKMYLSLWPPWETTSIMYTLSIVSLGQLYTEI